MTLSGKSDNAEALANARRIRRERDDASRAKHPWLFPLIVGLAVVVLVGAALYAFATGLL
jgi:hypothetical protein